MRNKSKRILSILMTVMIIISSMGFPVATAETAPIGVADHVIISQVYGGGGYNGATYMYDFVELYNPTGSEVNISNWTLQYAATDKVFGALSATNSITLTGTIPSGGYYLVRLAYGGAVGTDILNFNISANVNLGGTNGKVALVSNGDVLTDSNLTDKFVDDADIVDFVGYGSSNQYEGLGACPALSTTTSGMRVLTGVDTNDNKADFKVGAPNPRVGVPIQETKCSDVTSNVVAGSILTGTIVSFSTSTEGASIEYNIVAADATEWTRGSTFTVTANTTIYARATKSGLESSNVATFTYTLDETIPLTVGAAKETALNTENVKVKGIVSYIKNSDVYIQDSTGAICLTLTANAAKVKVGDEIVALGKRANSTNLVKLINVNEAVISVLSSSNAVPSRGTATIEQLTATPTDKTPGYAHMCEIIKIEGVALTSDVLLTQAGKTLTIFPKVVIANFTGVAIGDIVDATIRMYDFNGTLEAEIISMTKTAAVNQLFLNASHPSGDAISGATLTLTSSDAAAKIYYTLDGTDPTDASTLYAGSVKIVGAIGETITLKAIAKADGKTDSAVLTAVYKIKDPNVLPTIKDVLALPTGTANVEVKGTLSYFATTYSNPVIQQVVDGKTYALYVFGSAPAGAKIGDEVKFTGTYTVRYGQPQITPTTSSIVATGTPMAAKEMTITDIKTNGATMLGQIVKIKNVTLGTLNLTGNTPITDATGTINIYKPAPYPVQVVAGDIVDIYAMVAINNTTIQLYTGTKEANGFNIYDVVTDTKTPLLTLKDSYLDAKPAQDYTVAVTAEDNKGIKDVKISYTIGAKTVSDQAMTYVAVNNEYQFTIPGSEISASVDDFTFTVNATDVTGLSTTSTAKKIIIDNKPQITAVTPARNGSTGDVKNPLISVTLNNAGENPVVKLTLKKDNVVLVNDQVMTVDVQNVTYKYQTATLVDGIYNATLTVTRADNQTATTTWTFVVGTPTFRAYFGQLHGHTAEYSDGSGTLADGLNYLKGITAGDNVDFISFTDHSNYFDTATEINPADALNDKTKMTAGSLAKWNAYVSTITAFNQENAGSKLAMPGFEMTWSGGPGHINTFGSVGVISRNNKDLNTKTADAGLKAYYETLIKNPDPLANLSQFNHPGSTFGTFADFAYWSPTYDNKMVSVEIGNGEGAIGSGGYFPSYTEYTKALDKGWHVAPTNNQDNHKGRWGNANTARTVIITDEYTTTGMLKGLKNMSVYATEDKNLNINYTVNDLMMGSIISTVPTEALKFNVRVDDPDSDDVISKVEIITNSGRIAQSKTFTANSADWAFEIPSIQGYYYVRVTQADKNIAVTAPIWVGQAPLVGISSLATVTKLPVTNEVLEFKTTLFNNETSAVTLKSIQYTIKGSTGTEVLTSETPGTSIVSAGTFNHIYSYTPKTPGNFVVSVKAVMTVAGQDKEFTQDLAINVRDSEKLVYVGIDASHFNEYVQGNYKDSMGNFAYLAVESNVRVVELKTSAELIDATKNPKYKMLILTPPTRRNGTAFLMGYKNYTAEEIAAVKAFAELGNIVIITGWSDYYENYTKYTDGTLYTLPAAEHMSAQQNKLLEALGSTLRLSDDGANDTVNNGGSAQRLYLKDYNLDNPFLKSVKPLQQVFSYYGGSTIYAVGQDKLPTTSLPASVSPMVYSFTTSTSVDGDKDGTTSAPNTLVPKYADKFLLVASESVAYNTGKTGTIIVAGAAFMSNFEIQVDKDNWETPAYSNFTIVDNIIKTVNPVVITKIADLHAAPEGQSFTIQGIVTSNASGFDKETAFFDCIYVQDETGGINAFPVAGAVKAGQTVQITGKTSSYNGERQIAVEKIAIIDETIKALPAAKVLTTAQAASAMYLGSLVKVSGNITNLVYSNNVIESIFVKDASGTVCRVFIDGYITQNKVIANLAVGNNITATGLSSYDTEGARIRVRDRADVVCTAVSEPVEDTKPGNSKPNGSVENNENSKVVVSKITIKEMTQENGQITAPVSKANVNQMVDQLLKEDAKGKLSVLEIKAETNAIENDVKFVIDRSAFNQIATDTDASVKLSTGIGSIELDRKTLDTINAEAGTADVNISLVKVDSKALSTEMQSVIGDRPVYDFTISSGDQTVSSFGNGKVTVSLPYTLQPGEKANSVVIYYVDDSGKLQTVRGNYNEATKMVEFKTSHFSTYMVGYSAVSFKDVQETSWYYEAVSYVAARNITTGTGSEMFSPSQKITRGQFLVMMMNAYGIAPDTSIEANFADAGDTYYTAYLATAKKLGLVGGKGDNMFAPDALISRQDMVTMLYNALEMVNELPEITDVRNVSEFSDFSSVASYAKVAMEALVEGGYVSGKDNSLDPKGLATRAQMAQILYNLLVLE